MRNVDVSIIIVSYNTRDLLKKCLETVCAAARDLKAEILVVDNGSLDGSPDMVVSEFPNVLLIRSEKNLGFAKANNQAVERARGKYILFLNSDTEVHEDSIRHVKRYMDENPRVGICGCKLLNSDGTIQRSYGPFPSLVGAFLTNIPGLSKLRSSMVLPNDRPSEVDFVYGAFLMVRKNILNQVGSFDERFFIYAEDVDLCKRVKDAGWLVMYDPRVAVIHHGGASTNYNVGMHGNGTKFSDQSFFLLQESQKKYYLKHFGRLGLFWLRFIVIMGNLLVALVSTRFLLRGSFGIMQTKSRLICVCRNIAAYLK